MNQPTPVGPWYRYWERRHAPVRDEEGVAEDQAVTRPAGNGDAPAGGTPQPKAGAAPAAGPDDGDAEQAPAPGDDPAQVPARGGDGWLAVQRGPAAAGQAAAEAAGAEPSAGEAEDHGSAGGGGLTPPPAPTPADPGPAEAGLADAEAELFHVEPDEPASPSFHVEQDTRAPGPGPALAREVTGSPPPADVAESSPLADVAESSPLADVAEAPPADATAAGAVAQPGVLATHFERARVLTIANQKGGVGKTTTAVSVSAALAELGSRILLVDLDPQGNATSGVGVKVPPGQPTIYDVLVGDVDVEDAIQPTSLRNLFVVPSNLDLAGAEIELVSAFSREQKLRRALEPIREEFDVVLIDCPPSLGLLTVNALSAGDGLLVPIQCEYYALEGLGALRRNADLIRAQLNPDLDITGFILTMLDARTRLSQQVVDEVREHFGDKVFSSRIPRSIRLAEAPGFGQPITVFDPSSKGAMAYRRLATELLERLIANGPPPDRRTKGAPA